MFNIGDCLPWITYAYIVCYILDNILCRPLELHALVSTCVTSAAGVVTEVDGASAVYLWIEAP